MAAHIENIKSSDLKKVSKAELYAKLGVGDLVLTSGNYPESKVIKDITKSPFSHVLKVWLPFFNTEWLTLESTAQHGVHIARFSDYVDRYNGDLVVCHRPKLTGSNILDGLSFGFSLLGDRYDFNQEFEIACHKLFNLLPVSATKNQFFCSGLVQMIGEKEGLPFTPDKIHGAMCTPEDIFVDQTVEVKYAYCK